MGATFVSLGILLFILIFAPVIKEETDYRLSPPNPQIITTRDENFGIVIPKINANAKIIPNVDPYNSREYQLALMTGVAHAKGTVFPGHSGVSFLFSHSSVNFYEASRYNSIFYLIDKLEKDDEIDIFVRKEKFVYKVTGKKLVDPREVNYLTQDSTDKALILMTCWPPGTTFKRLLVFAKIHL